MKSEPTRLKHAGQAFVAITAKQLTKYAEEPEEGTWIKNPTGNTNTLKVGTKDNQTYPLAAGEEVILPVKSNQIWIVSTGGANEVQTLSISGSPTGGTFTITFDGKTTAPIAFDATAATVEAALEALDNIDDVSASGGPLPGSSIAITFLGVHSGVNVPLMTTTDSLTGGTAPASSIVETTAGSGEEIDFLVI